MVTNVVRDAGINADGMLVVGNVPDVLEGAGSAVVHWAIVAETGEVDTARQIHAFDTETNTIFAGTLHDDGVFVSTETNDGVIVDTNALYAVSYDSNDRFNIDPPEDGEPPVDPPDAAASYAAFERALSKDTGYTLTWEIIGRGSRATNQFNLTWT